MFSLVAGQFVSTYNICFATRVAWSTQRPHNEFLVTEHKSFKFFFYSINASYMTFQTLRVSTISVRMCSKLASIEETFESRKLTPGSFFTSSTQSRYSGQATLSKYKGFSTQLSPSGSQTLLFLRDWHVSWSISTKYFLSHKLTRSLSLKMTIPIIIAFITSVYP